jgi:large subunit ribosomal protein L23
MTPEQIIKRPLILTEKARTQSEDSNIVQFEVDRDANKIEIRDAVQSLFKVTVTNVNTLVMRGKMRRMGKGHAKLQNWKKAIVTLKSGDKIQFFQADTERVEASHGNQGLQAHFPVASLLQRLRLFRDQQEGPRARARREAKLDRRS